MTKRTPAATSVLLVATALAFLPLENLPSFDTPKLALLLAAAAVASFVAARRRDPEAPEVPLADPLLLVPAAVALAAAAAALASWPRGSLAGPALAVACVAAARLVRPGADGVRSTTRAASVAAAAAGLYAIVQFSGADPAPWGARRTVVATFGNTSFAAEFQAAALPLAAVLALRPGSRGDRALGAAAAVLAAAHLVLARSRIDLAAAAAAAVAVAVVAWPDRRRARILAGAACAAAVAAAVLFVLAARGHVAFLGRGDTLEVRLRVWAASLDVVADAPLRFAAAPFVDLFPPFRDPEEYRISLGRVVDTPHMDLLEIAAVLGFAGLAAAVAWIAAAARRIAALRAAAPWDAAALAGVVVAIGVSGLASSPLTHPATALLLALAAGHLAACAPRPLPRPAMRARTADFAAAAACVVALWPGPALPALRADGFHALAQSKRAESRALDAVRLFDAACAADPLAYGPRYELGSVLLSLGRADAAAEALASAVRIRRNSPDARTNLVHSLRESGRAGEADALLDESLAAFPWDPLLLAARAARASAAGRPADALADLGRAAPLRPWDLRIRAVLSDTKLGAAPDEAARNEALALLEEARTAGDFRVLTQAARAFARRDPLFLAVLAARARRAADAGDTDAATALVLAPVDRLSPPDAGFFDEAAKVLRACGRADDAARLAGRAMGLRARAAFAAGDVEEARRLAVRAADRDPLPDHRVLEALCLARGGSRRSVIEALSAAAALGPIDVAAIRADPGLAALLPDPDIDALLDRAAARPPH